MGERRGPLRGGNSGVKPKWRGTNTAKGYKVGVATGHVQYRKRKPGTLGRKKIKPF